MSEYPEQVIDPKASWPLFVAELQEEILPLYLSHEQTFDSWSIHGRIHICRCVLFIAFHDSGRQGNGADQYYKF